MSKPKTTIADQLAAAQLAVTNSLADDEIKALVAAYGYSVEKLNEGQELFSAAKAAVSAQQAAAGAQQLATEALVAAKTQAVDAYQSLAKISRAVSGPGSLAVLGLSGRMPQDINGFLNTAATLFDNAASLPALTSYGYDDTRLSAERAKIDAYCAANDRQEAAKGAALHATREQDAALAALKQWTAQYIKIARVALRANPELLHKLGVAS